MLREDAEGALTRVLLPMATLVTPNVREASVLSGRPIETLEQVKDAARAIADLGPRAVVITGGLGSGPATDLLYAGGEFKAFTNARIATTSTHGTGCTFASAIAAGLAKGLRLEEAVGQAKEYVTEAIRASLDMGAGHGPLNHFYMLGKSLK